MILISITTPSSGGGCGTFIGRNCDGRGLESNSSKLWQRRRRVKGWEKGRCMLKVATTGARGQDGMVARKKRTCGYGGGQGHDLVF